MSFRFEGVRTARQEQPDMSAPLPASEPCPTGVPPAAVLVPSYPPPPPPFVGPAVPLPALPPAPIVAPANPPPPNPVELVVVVFAPPAPVVPLASATPVSGFWSPASGR